MAQFQDVPDVPIGTSSPLDLCKGFPMLPTGAVRAGIAVGGQSKPLFSKGLNLLLFKINASASYNIFLGMCGPATAFLIVSDVETTPKAEGFGEVSLTVSEDALAAGFVVGFNLGAHIGLTESVRVPKHWYTPWEWKWSKAWSQSAGANLDLINLIAFVLTKVLTGRGQSILKKVNSIFSNALTSSWGLYDERSHQLIANKGKLDANPTFTLPINIVPLTAEIPFLDVLFGFDEALQAIGGSFALGPTLSLEVPVQVELDQITVDGTAYSIDGYTGLNIVASGDMPISDTPQKVGMNVSYRARFTIGAGVFVSISAFKIFGLSLHSPSLDLLSLLGIPEPKGTTYHGSVCTDLTELQPDICSAGSPAAGGRMAVGSSASYEIIFEEPEVAA